MLLFESAETVTLPSAVTLRASAIKASTKSEISVARARARDPGVATHRDAQRDALDRGRRGTRRT